MRNGAGVVFVGEHRIDPCRIDPIVHWMPWIWLGVAGVCLAGGVRLFRR